MLGTMEDHRERDGTGYVLEEFDKTSVHVQLPQYKCQMQDVDLFSDHQCNTWLLNVNSNIKETQSVESPSQSHSSRR